MKKVFIISLALVITTSCKSVYQLYYGIHNPKIESAASLLKYANKIGMNCENIYTLKTFDFYTKTANIVNGCPDVLMFNKKLKNIVYKNNEQCNAATFSGISSLNKLFVYEINDSISFDEITAELCDLYGNAKKIEIDKKSDFVVIIYWAKFTGRLNKNHVKIWETNAFENKNANIQVVKINMDLQSFWNKKM